MVRDRRAAAACLIFAIAVTIPAVASVSTARFGVTAQVVARTSIEAVDEPATFMLTSADIDQGYKILDARYRVHTGGGSRFLLNVAPRTGLASAIHIEGLGAPVTLGDTDITVLQPAASSVSELHLRFRLELNPRLPVGTYPLPVRLSVAPPAFY
jgi:hypothetical protein